MCAQWRGRQDVDLINMNADTFFTPASNTKLYTVAAAQKKLGNLDATLATTLSLRIESRSGGGGESHSGGGGGSRSDSSAMAVVLKGSGDPCLTFAQLRGATMAIAPKLGAIDSVVDIEVDVSAFGRSAVPAAWDWDYVSTTSGIIPSSVVVDRNTMNLHVQATAADVRRLRATALHHFFPAQRSNHLQHSHVSAVCAWNIGTSNIELGACCG